MVLSTSCINDQKGDVVAVTDDSGHVVETSTYEPYGLVQSGGTATRYGYETKEADSVLGDTDFNARRYKPDWGIFETRIVN